MSRKREQRLRRKGLAKVRAVERKLTDKLADANQLRAIAVAAIQYIGAIDAPDLREPFAIANQRNELADFVHAYQGRPERLRRDHQVVAIRVPAMPVKAAAPTVPVSRFPTQPLPRRKEVRASNVQLTRELEVKRREMANAAKRLGAEANKRASDPDRVAYLSDLLDVAARAFTRAEQRLAMLEAAA